MPLLDHFGFVAPFYEHFIHPPLDTDWPALLGLSRSQTILDVGGGTGRVSRLFSGNGHAIVILDASLKMLAEVQDNDHIYTVCGLSEWIPFPGHSFDRVLMVDAFHHLKNQAVSGRELWRVLKPGGRLVIEEPDFRLFSVKLIAAVEKMLLMRSHFWTAEKIAYLFRDLPCQVQITRQKGSVYVIVDSNLESVEKIDLQARMPV